MEWKLNINPLNHYIKKRIEQNRNALIIVNGATGSGKTYVCLRLAQDCAALLGTNFTIKDNLAFKFTDFLEKAKLPQNSKPGTPFVFEEVGAFGGGASAREWQSQSNKFFFSFMQTSRHKNQILFMNCPNFSYLDKGSRELVHIQIQCEHIDHKKRAVIVKPFILQVNSKTGKIYFKNLRYNEKGKRTRLSFLAIDHPGEEIAKEYEILKMQYTNALNDRIMREQKVKEIKQERELAIVEEKQEVVQQTSGRLLTIRQVQEYLDLDRSTITRYLTKGRLKGMKIGSKWLIDEDFIRKSLENSSITPKTTETNSTSLEPQPHTTGSVENNS